MGLRNSKNNSKSYDVATVVSNKDFTYKKHRGPLPKVELPVNNAIVGADNKYLTEIVEQKELIVAAHSKDLTDIVEQKELIEIEVYNVVETKDIPELHIPLWVNEDNFKKLLLKTNSDIKNIADFKILPAVKSGENYGSLMLRIKVTVNFENNSTKVIYYMLKVAHDSQPMKDMLHAMNFFITENAVYSEVIPELEAMYHQAGLEIAFGPKSYRLELDDNNIHYILLDDLCVRGFKNVNRLECLNMEHTLSVLHKMAQFHAASACRVAKLGSYPAIFSPDLDDEMARAMLTKLFMPFKKPFLENLKLYDNGEKYYDIMNNFFDNLIELLANSRKLFPAYFCVLNHGDCWSNNILFKYKNDGKLEETLFVDFQASDWGSPALDLYYFIISSVQIDIKLTHFDYFIRYYHEHLSNYLKLLEYSLDIPKLKDFHIQLIDFGSWATMTSFFTLGFVLLEPTLDGVTLDNFLGDSEESRTLRNSMYDNKRYRKYINEILPWLYNRGFMETNLM